MTRSRKVIDAAPTWAPFAGWSILLEHTAAGIGLARPSEIEHSFALRLSKLASALAASAGAAIAGLPAESYHITLCDGVNTGMRRNTSPNWSRLVEAGAALSALGDDIDALCATARQPALWRPAALEIRGSAVVVAVETDADLGEMREQRRRLLERLGSIVGAELVTPWHPHITLGYLLDDENIEQHRSSCVTAWATTLPQPNDHPATLLTDRAAIYEFSDMATFRSVSPRCG